MPDAPTPADAAADAPPPQCLRRIVYVTGSPGAREVWSAWPDGSDPVDISNNAADDIDPSWSPDGSAILFRSRRAGNWDVWTARPDGTAPRNLTRSTADETRAVWSPNGAKVAFTRSSGLWVMAADGTLATQVAPQAVSGSIAWSPSGLSILFGSRPDGVNDDLYKVAVGGGTPRNLTASASGESGGTWSPDGQRIAFGRLGPASNSDLWTMATDGSDQINLTENTPATYDAGGVWAAGGTQLVFTSNREGGYKVFRTPASGGPITRVSDNDLSGGITGDWITDAADAGEEVLFTRYLPQNHYEVGTVELGGVGLHTFSDPGQTALAGGWSPCL